MEKKSVTKRVVAVSDSGAVQTVFMKTTFMDHADINEDMRTHREALEAYPGIDTVTVASAAYTLTACYADGRVRITTYDFR